MMRPDVYGHTFFCEDIRTEADGKITIVGMLPGAAMRVHGGEFPVTVPKFVFWIQYFEEIGKVEDDLEIRIFAPGEEDPIVTATIPLQQVRENQGPPPNKLMEDGDGELRRFLHFPFVFAPLNIKQPGFFRIRGTSGSRKELTFGSLLVEKGEFKP